MIDRDGLTVGIDEQSNNLFFLLTGWESYLS